MFTPSRVVWRGSSRPLRSTASCIIRIITGSAGCLVQKPPGTPPHPPSPSLHQLRRDDSLLGRHIRHDVPKALAAQPAIRGHPHLARAERTVLRAPPTRHLPALASLAKSVYFFDGG